MPFPITSSDLQWFGRILNLTTRSIARPLCDSWASCMWRWWRRLIDWSMKVNRRQSSGLSSDVQQQVRCVSLCTLLRRAAVLSAGRLCPAFKYLKWHRYQRLYWAPVRLRSRDQLTSNGNVHTCIRSAAGEMTNHSRVEQDDGRGACARR